MRQLNTGIHAADAIAAAGPPHYVGPLPFREPMPACSKSIRRKENACSEHGESIHTRGIQEHSGKPGDNGEGHQDGQGHVPDQSCSPVEPPQGHSPYGGAQRHGPE